MGKSKHLLRETGPCVTATASQRGLFFFSWLTCTIKTLKHPEVR